MVLCTILKVTKVNLFHLCFVDDQLIFYAANKDSIEANNQFLIEFKAPFGLATNVSKFEVSFSEVSAEVKGLRVPLISMKTNCGTLQAFS